MFYVSSRKGDLFGITDTSDGVEEFYTLNDITKFVDQDIPIEGITVKIAKDRSWSYVIRVINKPKTYKQTKQALVAGFTVEADNGYLRRLVLTDSPTLPDRIVISDYCEYVCDYSFYLQAVPPKLVTLVFDDKIKSVGPNAFSSFSPARVVIDVSSITNEELLDKIYLAAIVNGHLDSRFLDDSEMRFHCKIAEYRLFYTDSLYSDLSQEQDAYIIQRRKQDMMNMFNEVKINSKPLRRYKDDHPYDFSSDSAAIINCFRQIDREHNFGRNDVHNSLFMANTSLKRLYKLSGMKAHHFDILFTYLYRNGSCKEIHNKFREAALKLIKK